MLWDKEASADDVKAKYPIGSKVKLTEAALDCFTAHMWNVDIQAIINARWEVLNYYYKVGSRKKTFLGMVVGLPYSTLMLLNKDYQVHSTTYGQIGDTIKDTDGKSGRLYDEDRAGKSHLAALILRDWENGRYMEVQSDEPKPKPKLSFAEELF